MKAEKPSPGAKGPSFLSTAQFAEIRRLGFVCKRGGLPAGGAGLGAHSAPRSACERRAGSSAQDRSPGAQDRRSMPSPATAGGRRDTDAVSK